MSKKLKDLVKITMGQSPSSSKYNTNKKGVPLIQGNADLNNGVVNPKVYTTQITKKAEKGDIILTVRAPVGDIAITNIDCCIGRGVCAIKGDEFYYYLLENLKSKNIWKKYVQGTTIESINTNDLSNLKVRVPTNKNEIKKITVLLKKTDSKLRLMERKHKLLIKFKLYLLNKIFKSSFSDEWMIRKLSDIAVIGKGFTPSTRNPDFWDGEYSWLSIADMPENNESKYITNSKKTITQEGTKNRNIIKKGTLIMSFKLSVGKLGILKKDMYTNEAICNFTWKKEDISTEYMYYYLSSINIMKYGAQAVKGVTLNNDSLNSIPIKLPPVKVQEKIALFLSYIDRKIELSNKQIDLMKNYKSGLLQKMFI